MLPGALVVCVALWGAQALRVGDRVGGFPGSSSQNWTLTWQDEFPGSSLNTSNWTPANDYLHQSQELNLYFAYNVWVENGSLVLRTQYDPQVYDGQQFQFTSGQVDSQGKFFQKFGRFDISAKLPSNSFCSIWPANWMMPEPEFTVPPNVCWPVGGEIDIMEFWGCWNDDLVNGTIHYATQCDQDLDHISHGYPNASTPPIDWSADYHVFSVEWDTEQISWFVDGNFYGQRYQNDAPSPYGAIIPQTPFYMILNTAISWWTPPPPTDLTVYMYIDYVRAYQASE
eukprot:m.76875 g.76875  ORF g.76875 m.76875 type:complete len:284 (-) comp50464_c0_seq1:26-877(-)